MTEILEVLYNFFATTSLGIIGADLIGAILALLLSFIIAYGQKSEELLTLPLLCSLALQYMGFQVNIFAFIIYAISFLLGTIQYNALETTTIQAYNTGTSIQKAIQ